MFDIMREIFWYRLCRLEILNHKRFLNICQQKINKAKKLINRSKRMGKLGNCWEGWAPDSNSLNVQFEF